MNNLEWFDYGLAMKLTWSAAKLSKKAIPYGQALRFRMMCSEDRQCQERVGELAGWRKERGYEESLVNEPIDRVRRLDRTTLLANSENRTNDQGRGERVPFVANVVFVNAFF